MTTAPFAGNSMKTKISAKVIADSTSSSGDRLTTMELVYPRFIHGEVMAHRAFSRNAASSRAIPVKKLLKQVWSDPAMPTYWGTNKPGMQAGEQLDGWRLRAVRSLWRLASKVAVALVYLLMKLNLHKQIANRILEPWMWMTTIVTATMDGYANLYYLRRHPDAQPEFFSLATVMYEAHKSSKPQTLEEGEWHLPYLQWYEKLDVKHGHLSVELAKKLSTARCARVSYLNHDGTKPNKERDIKLHDMLAEAPHASPFEHVATPSIGRHANFLGWRQYRKELPNENHTTYGEISWKS